MVFENLMTKIWTDAISKVAEDGAVLAKEMLKDPSKLQDMQGISESFDDLFQKADGAAVAESIFRDFFATVGGVVVGGLATVGSVPFVGP